MSKSNYEQGFSAGAKSEHDRSVAALMDHSEYLYDRVEEADDPAWEIARAEAVEDCITLLKKVRTDENSH
jgi:hypothetical protein